ncbi:hypothetical protein HAX54_036789 [Datura stramonium]|uniref:BZIP domain-containing protein n=1 Tax=Datura stramonium TaxID=4076 RepID=A0ABS8RMC4_DATST|nr:hypothetical protein [Datura stramonium]
MDDQLDKLYQAFNDYKKERSMDDIDPKDFMDNYFAQNNATNYDYDAQSTIIQISRDFEAFERTELRPPATKTPIEFSNNIDQLGENVHEFERMVEEMDSAMWPCSVACYEGDGRGDGQLISGMASGSSKYDAQSSTAIMKISKDFEAFERTKLTPPTETLVDFSNSMDQLGEEDVDETERMIEEMASQYTSSNVHPCYNAFGCHNNVVNMACYDIANGSCSPVIRYFFCGQTKNVAKTNNHRRKRQKRKYRGVVMSEEQRLLKMAKQKIKNREVAARTHEMRLAREAHLESQRMNLLKQNDFLKKIVTFLEAHKRINMPYEPLRRTISGPMLIQ